VARELKEASIPYMVIGGQAVLLYGEPRLTRDIITGLIGVYEGFFVFFDQFVKCHIASA
jgi:hypothetical protein